MGAGNAVVPSRISGRPIEVVRAIRRTNCDRGCAHQAQCSLLDLVLGEADQQVPDLVDDGVRIHCLRRQPPPSPAPALRDAVELPLFDVEALSCP
jgi:hypothetical protein